MEQKSWHIVCQTVGYYRYGTSAELVKKVHSGAKISKKYDTPATPSQWALAGTDTVCKVVKAKLSRENKPLNLAAIKRQIQALCGELLALTTAKQGTKPSPAIRAKSEGSANQTRRAS